MATKVVEVRFDAEVHDLTQKQVMGLLKAFDSNFDISVGLGYGGKAAAVILDAPEADAVELGHEVKDYAQTLGLTVTLVEVLDTEAYNERALAEDI